MNLGRIAALPPIQAGLPALVAQGHGGAAIELPRVALLQFADPLLPCRLRGAGGAPGRHAGASRLQHTATIAEQRKDLNSLRTALALPAGHARWRAGAGAAACALSS